MNSVFLIVLTFAVSIFVHGQCNLTYSSVNPLCHGVCNGQATVFPTGSAPFDFTWSTGDTTQTVDSLCAGTYTVNMVDDLGCTVAASITLTEPAIPFTVDTYLISNSSVSGPCEGQIGWTTSGGQPDYTINWYDCNTMNLYTTLPYFCAGEYFVVFIDNYGCVDTSDCVIVTNNVVGVFEVFLSNEVTIYPNPATNSISFSNPGDNSDVLVMDLQGKVVYRTTTSCSKITLDVSTFERGIYLVQVKSASGITTKKIVLQ